MPNYDLTTREGLAQAAKAAKQKADHAPDQDCYNAAYLHGFADALNQVDAQLQFPTDIATTLRDEYDKTVNVLEEAEKSYQQDRRNVKKRRAYQFAIAQEFAISDLCYKLGVVLRDENLNLIKGNRNKKGG